MAFFSLTGDASRLIWAHPSTIIQGRTGLGSVGMTPVSRFSELVHEGMVGFIVLAMRGVL